MRKFTTLLNLQMKCDVKSLFSTTYNYKYLLIVLSLYFLPFTSSALDSTLRDIKVGTATRSMIIYVPTGLPANRPLVISMHGSGQDPAYQQSKALWENVADTAKFAVVYPKGNSSLQWDLGGTSDTDFILAIIDTMANRYQIDRNRVYLNGFSMGGMMVYYAATKIADKIAAFAPVSGYLMGGPNTNSSRPIPIIHTHGTADDVVAYSGVQPCLDAWITRNGCSTTAEVTAPYPTSNPSSICTKSYWAPGPNGVAITLMTLKDKGHWYSLDIAGGINTSIEVWNFCKQYSLSSGNGNVYVNKLAMSGFSYILGSGPSANQNFTVAANLVKNNVVLQAPSGYEISLSAESGYTSALTLLPTNGIIATTTVYVRMKAGLVINNYVGNLTVTADGVLCSSIALSGSVNSEAIIKIYDFSADIASTDATNPPAVNISMGIANPATAGVVSYTDKKGVASNMFRAYSGETRHSSGVVTLDKFSKKGTDYSVVWKQCIGTDGNAYKAGILLRGDSAKFGDATVGYVEGLMQGYLCLVYNNTTSGSEFRIYKATNSSTSLAIAVNAYINTLIPTAGQPIWYRASVSGNTSAIVKFEYSTDSIAWVTASTLNDATKPYTNGATQIVWGLGVANYDFYLDNITFRGIEDATPTAVNEVAADDATIVSTDYYTFTGQRVLSHRNTLKGLYIVRNVLSNGKLKVSKVFLR